MNYRFLLISVSVSFLLLMSSCHSTPDHAKFIPKNALMVAEVNTKELSKKIAWSMITGSNLWDKLRGSKSKEDSTKQSEFIKNMQEAGVDELNTFYAYLKNSGSIEKEACFVALIPLKDAMKWESFVKKSFSEAKIKENKQRKEAKLTSEIYAGWTNNLLILVSVQRKESGYFEEENTDLNAIDEEVLLASHLESAFTVSTENSLLSDPRFAAFEKHKHDLGFWVNIDAIMTSYGAKNLGMMTGGLSLSNTMWRNTAFSSATNFNKGRIVTEMMLYNSEDLKDINKQYSNKNIEKDVVDRIPNEGLDYVFAYHMSPEGLQKTIEKMGMLGLANGYLQEQGLTVEEIMSATTGDMVFSMNNFQQKKERILFDSLDESSAFSSYKTDMDILFALKINKIEAFNKLLELAIKMEMLEETMPGVYKMKSMGSASDSSVILVNEKYAVFANKKILGQNYLSGNQMSKSSLKIKEHIQNHPFGMFFDYNSWAKRTAGTMATNAADSLVYFASLKTFDNLVFNGGNLENNASKYQLSINFVDKNQSSLLQLFDFSKVLQQAQNMRDIENEKMQLMYEQEADTTSFQ